MSCCARPFSPLSGQSPPPLKNYPEEIVHIQTKIMLVFRVVRQSEKRLKSAPRCYAQRHLSLVTATVEKKAVEIFYFKIISVFLCSVWNKFISLGCISYCEGCLLNGGGRWYSCDRAETHDAGRITKELKTSKFLPNVRFLTVEGGSWTGATSGGERDRSRPSATEVGSPNYRKHTKGRKKKSLGFLATTWRLKKRPVAISPFKMGDFFVLRARIANREPNDLIIASHSDNYKWAAKQTLYFLSPEIGVGSSVGDRWRD